MSDYQPADEGIGLIDGAMTPIFQQVRELVNRKVESARKEAAETMREQCAKALEDSLLPKPVSDAAAQLIRALEVEKSND